MNCKGLGKTILIDGGRLMPRGVYPHNENQRKTALINFAKGRLPAARKKARLSLKKNAADIEWRKKVSEATTRAMHRSDVRKRHLDGLARAHRRGPFFKGGHNMAPLPLMKQLSELLIPLGFLPEYKILTGTKSRCYYADFANPERMMIIELDGASHNSFRAKESDRIRDAVLQSLGWIVLRIAYTGDVSGRVRLRL